MSGFLIIHDRFHPCILFNLLIEEGSESKKHLLIAHYGFNNKVEAVIKEVSMGE